MSKSGTRRKEPGKAIIVATRTYELVRKAADQLGEHMYVLVEQGFERLAREVWQPEIDSRAKQAVDRKMEIEVEDTVRREEEYDRLAAQFLRMQEGFLNMARTIGDHKGHWYQDGVERTLKAPSKPGRLVELEKEFGFVPVEEI